MIQGGCREQNNLIFEVTNGVRGRPKEMVGLYPCELKFGLAYTNITV